MVQDFLNRPYNTRLQDNKINRDELFLTHTMPQMSFNGVPRLGSRQDFEELNRRMNENTNPPPQRSIHADQYYLPIKDHFFHRMSQEEYNKIMNDVPVDQSYKQINKERNTDPFIKNYTPLPNYDNKPINTRQYRPDLNNPTRVPLGKNLGFNFNNDINVFINPVDNTIQNQKQSFNNNNNINHNINNNINNNKNINNGANFNMNIYRNNEHIMNITNNCSKDKDFTKEINYKNNNTNINYNFNTPFETMNSDNFREFSNPIYKNL
jgi:hypothetical protein